MMSNKVIILLLSFAVLFVLGILKTLHNVSPISDSLDVPDAILDFFHDDLSVNGVRFIITGLGVALLILVVVGFIGWHQHSMTTLVIFGFLLVLLAITDLCWGLYLRNRTTDLPASLEKFLRESFNDPNMDTFHDLESQFKCCGMDGPDFYMTFMGQDYVAPSCCAGGKYCSKTTAYQRGCLRVLKDDVVNDFLSWSYVFFVYGVIQFAAAAIALYYAGNHTEDEEEDCTWF